jgi:hypothetical protein
MSNYSTYANHLDQCHHGATRGPGANIRIGIRSGRKYRIRSIEWHLGVLNTTSSTPSLLHQIPLPTNYLKGSTGAAGVALTHDGGHVLVSLGTGAIIVDVAKAINGSSSAIIGAVNGTAGDSAIEVAVTPDGSSAFVSQEYGNQHYGHKIHYLWLHIHII